MKKDLFFISFFLVFLLFFQGFLYIERQTKTPLNPKGEFLFFEIKKGEGVFEISKRLEKKGLIKNKFYFLFYVVSRRKFKSLKAGTYLLSPKMTIAEIVEKIEKGKEPFFEVKITIPEGFTLSQIEEKIEKAFSLKDFDLALSSFKIKDFKEKYKILSDAPDKASLEGYLFPDTYFFKLPTKKEEYEKARRSIIEKFLSNFEKKFKKEWQLYLKKQGKKIFEIVTLASILEKEVARKEDKKIVSGIFWKRIKKGKPLESCATIAYLLKKDWNSFEEMRRDIYSAKKIDSPYNTYLYPGLPKGPISNPGLDSLEAAIFPKFTDYNYFLTDPKTKKTIFAKTYREHLKNKAKYFGK